ncbi:amino acid transporter [Brucella endophytica]|uniref:amino acid transporter n=1 Tax=Brucella endophytica TaxID=1963359 RepID=UPI001668D373|nr:amino acid transporter [Brucella endophytica]
MTLIHNERIKLLATYLNGIGIALFAVGGLAPLFSALYSNSGPTLFLIFMSMNCVIVSAGLHYMASIALRRMRT